MNHSIRVCFARTLERYDLNEDPLSGPSFHRWIPDGRKDALKVALPDYECTLRLWFERRGYVEDGLLLHAHDRFEFDPEVMAAQGRVEAGALWGDADFQVADDLVQRMISADSADAEYVRFAKVVLTKVFYPNAARLINILRTTYGQYWLNPLDAWDSREMGLAHYSRAWNAQWSTDGGATWAPFLPTDEPRSVTLQFTLGTDWKPLLDRADWEQLAQLMQEDFTPSLAASLVSRAHELYDQGRIRHAIVDAATALEAALDVVMSNAGDAELKPILRSFWSVPLKTQVACAVLLRGSGDYLGAPTLSACLRGIDLRNAIVHEGREPSADDAVTVKAMLRVASSLLPGPEFKFPSWYMGNERKPIENWDVV